MKKEEKKKKSYTPPRLIRYGKVTELTTGAAGSIDDGFGGQSLTPPVMPGGGPGGPGGP